MTVEEGSAGCRRSSRKRLRRTAQEQQLLLGSPDDHDDAAAAGPGPHCTLMVNAKKKKRRHNSDGGLALSCKTGSIIGDRVTSPRPPPPPRSQSKRQSTKRGKGIQALPKDTLIINEPQQKSSHNEEDQGGLDHRAAPTYTIPVAVSQREDYYPLVPLASLPHNLLRQRSSALDFFPSPKTEGFAPFLGSPRVSSKDSSNEGRPNLPIPLEVHPQCILGLTGANLAVFKAEFEGISAAWKPAYLRSSPGVLFFNSETRAYKRLNELGVHFVPRLLFSGVWQTKVGRQDELTRLLVTTAVEGSPRYNSWTLRQAKNVEAVYKLLHEKYYIVHGVPVERNILFTEDDEVHLVDWANFRECVGTNDPLIRKEQQQVSRLIKTMTQ